MMSMDEVLHEAYNSIKQEDGSWIYTKTNIFKKKPIPKKITIGKRILDKRRGRIINDHQRELY